ncbi:hypothetical protein MRS44_001030 [Fusarium solani]|uniref:uncharacterized protein n=1 Tax=Fusarium solani TaxID=169388 RepID=UPI0032C4AFD1|nr:hypothetical protein MRS44_001030 [Fusarium solani]
MTPPPCGTFPTAGGLGQKDGVRQPRDLTASARKDSPHQVSKAEHEEAGTQANLPLDGLKQNTNRSAARVGSLTPGAGLSSTAQQHNGARYFVRQDQQPASIATVTVFCCLALPADALRSDPEVTRPKSGRASG